MEMRQSLELSGAEIRLQLADENKPTGTSHD
jgi:hypothetical protein